MKLFIASLILTTFSSLAYSAPPPVGSEDWEIMSDYTDWIRDQHTSGGAPCCDLSDGRPLFDDEWKKTEDGYEVFVSKRHWPDAAENGRWVKVPKSVIIPGGSPVGLPILWWIPADMHPYANGVVLCFAPVGGV